MRAVTTVKKPKAERIESETGHGCAAKVPAQEFDGMIRGVDMPASPAVLVGPDTLDDAGETPDRFVDTAEEAPA